MSQWSNNTRIRDDKYEDTSNTKNTDLAMKAMSKTPRKESIIERAVKRAKEIGNIEI